MLGTNQPSLQGTRYFTFLLTRDRSPCRPRSLICLFPFKSPCWGLAKGLLGRGKKKPHNGAGHEKKGGPDRPRPVRRPQPARALIAPPRVVAFPASSGVCECRGSTLRTLPAGALSAGRVLFHPIEVTRLEMNPKLCLNTSHVPNPSPLFAAVKTGLEEAGLPVKDHLPDRVLCFAAWHRYATEVPHPFSHPSRLLASWLPTPDPTRRLPENAHRLSAHMGVLCRLWLQGLRLPAHL